MGLMRLSSRRVVTAALLAAGVAGAGEDAAAQSRSALHGTHAGVSAGIMVLGRENESGDVDDLTHAFGVGLRHGIGTGRLSLQLDATVSRPARSDATAELDARTSLCTFLLGPVLAWERWGVSPYVGALAGAAATRMRGATIPAEDVNGRRTVGEESWAFAYGASAGVRLFLTAGAHPLGLELGGRILDMGELGFVQPRTDIYRRDLGAVELRAGITIGLYPRSRRRPHSGPAAPVDPRGLAGTFPSRPEARILSHVRAPAVGGWWEIAEPQRPAIWRSAVAPLASV